AAVTPSVQLRPTTSAGTSVATPGEKPVGTFVKVPTASIGTPGATSTRRGGCGSEVFGGAAVGTSFSCAGRGVTAAGGVAGGATRSDATAGWSAIRTLAANSSRTNCVVFALAIWSRA